MENKPAGPTDSVFETLGKIQSDILEDHYTPDELQSIYLGQVALMLGAIDDDLKALRQTLSNMTGVIKEVKKDD